MKDLPTNKILQGDALEILKTLPTESVHCCVTSPPYWGLRDYGITSQIGLEKTPEEYVARLVEVFREVRRVLRQNGTLWLNVGDSYAGSWKNQGRKPERGTQRPIRRPMIQSFEGHPAPQSNAGVIPPGLKPKDLVGVPWRIAFALQADGWYLRMDNIWAKPNPMPESVTDRPTKAHEYVFLMSKSERYYYDALAIREPDAGTDHARKILHRPEPSGGVLTPHQGIRTRSGRNGQGRNKRSVWFIPNRPFPGAHFATFPEHLVEPCILASTSEGGVCSRCGTPFRRVTGPKRPVEGRGSGNMTRKLADGSRTRPPTHLGSSIPWSPTKTPTLGWRPSCHCVANPVPGVVLDPFFGAGTTGLVALKHGRQFLGIELKPEYVEMSRKRIAPEMAQGRLF